MSRLLPEWHPQWGVMIAWPHPDTDWAYIMDRAEATYQALAHAILKKENLLILCRDQLHEKHIREQLGQVDQSRLHMRQLDYNDTWARDFGPLCVIRNGDLLIKDFVFNGWGGKFEATLDNASTSKLDWNVPVEAVPLVMEGGSLEINSHGQLLTTRYCLLNPNRNPDLSQADIEAQLEHHLGATQVWWLGHGDLEGDDTDAHIDTLARFCDDSTIAYVQCTDKTDSHYDELAKMEQELQTLSAQYQLKLVPLPMTPALFDDDGHRLPATYANFLIINGAVLLPVYGCDTDALAVSQMEKAFPHHEIVPIDCLALTWQHGSLHCVTMQLPQGVRKTTSTD
ncbi:MAG: agmatine deiminase family protein [Alcanivoracaceae bacterium]|nr:agmatine deiminase family protein [Alcanivoracaceae bacterium]